MGCDPTGKVTQLHSFVSLCCTHKHNPVHSDHQHGWPSSSHSFLSTPLMNHWQDPYALNPLSCKLAAKQKQSKTPACSFYVILLCSWNKRYSLGIWWADSVWREASEKIHIDSFGTAFRCVSAVCQQVLYLRSGSRSKYQSSWLKNREWGNRWPWVLTCLDHLDLFGANSWLHIFELAVIDAIDATVPECLALALALVWGAGNLPGRT